MGSQLSGLHCVQSPFLEHQLQGASLPSWAQGQKARQEPYGSPCQDAREKKAPGEL